MGNMMQNCWDWMMSLDMGGMIIGTVLLIAFVALLVLGIIRLIRGPRK